MLLKRMRLNYFKCGFNVFLGYILFWWYLKRQLVVNHNFPFRENLKIRIKRFFLFKKRNVRFFKRFLENKINFHAYKINLNELQRI